MSDSLNQPELYRALAEKYRRLAATSSSTEIRDRYLRMARIARITAGWPSPKNQADQPTTISAEAMATENANNARPARTSTETSRFPKPWRIVEIPNGFAVDDATGRQLGVFYGRADPNTAGHTGFVMIDEARQMAVDFARLPELLKQTSDRSKVATSAEDDKRAKLQTSRSPERAPETSYLPRAAQLPAVTGLPLVEEATTVPHSISFGRDGWKSTPLLHWPSDPLFNRAKFLIATAIAVAALPAGYFIFGSSDRPVDVAVAPQATTDVPPVEFLPLRKADAPSTNATGVTVDMRAEPEVQTESLRSAGHLDIKPSSGEAQLIADRELAPGPPSNDTNFYVESRPKPEVQTESLQSAGHLDIKPTENGIEAKPPQTVTERWSFAASPDASTCFQSASDVRQNSPGTWPSWTLRALGHEGTRCWYAGTRFTAHHHRSEMRRKETVQATEKLEFPRVLFGTQ